MKSDDSNQPETQTPPCSHCDAPRWYNSDFALFVGIGLLVALVCLGIGGCAHLFPK